MKPNSIKMDSSKLIPIIGLIMGIILTSDLASAQEKNSEWGPKDQKGAKNRITSDKVTQAAKLIKEGKIYELGQVYEESMPLGGRHFTLNHIGPLPNDGSDQYSFVSNGDFHTGELGQIGTQFDALGHMGVRTATGDYYYNGIKGSEMYSSRGLRKLGVENVGPFFTRGVMIDVARYKEVDRLEAGYVITVEDLQGALERQNVEIKEGDVVLVRTGHSQLWKVDNDAYYDWVGGEPGIGVSSGQWLVDQKVVMVGADNYAVDVVPFESTATTRWPVHVMLLKENGIYILENLKLEELSKDEAYEFAFVFSPLPVKGATGSPGNPIAIR